MVKRLGLIVSLFLLVGFIPSPAYAICTPALASVCLPLTQLCSDHQTCCSSTSDCPTSWRFSPFEGCNVAKQEINTAIGCVPTDFGGLFAKFFSLGVGIGGGIAFLLILFGGFQVMTSAGNPEQLNAGRELIVSAISGLLMVIFSVFLLKLIGVNILGIPGFS